MSSNVASRVARSARFNGIPQVKRFLERWTSDPRFRTRVEQDPYGAVADARIEVDPVELGPLWDDRVRPDGAAAPPEPVRRYREHYKEQVAWRDGVIRASSPSEPRFKAWRLRQMARCRHQMYLGNENAVVHAPICFELSKGCSVGCWFCGVGAQKLTERFLYTSENARLWREVIDIAGRLIGTAAAQGFCYWATDPLDNPDYERFCLDFADRLGLFPQTTTALATKDVARTRRLLATSRERGCHVNRFSLMSLGLLDRVHREFSAEELSQVELIAQNPDSTLVKANAGAFRERARERPELAEREREKLERIVRSRVPEADQMLVDLLAVPSQSIACVSGFLVNMVERSVRLISPCNADERWPLGYLVFEEGSFETAADFAALLEGMLARHMTTQIAAEDRLAFGRGNRFEPTPGGFKVSSRTKDVSFDSPNQAEYMRFLGERMEAGDSLAGQAALAALYRFGVPESDTLKLLNRIKAMGIFDEEPPTTARGAS